MESLEFLKEYFIPVIAGICLCVGFVVKKWVDDVDNKWIPTINAVLGVGLALIMYWGHIDAAVILAGLFSGLASTGLFEAFRQLITKNEMEEK